MYRNRFASVSLCFEKLKNIFFASFCFTFWHKFFRFAHLIFFNLYFSFFIRNKIYAGFNSVRVYKEFVVVSKEIQLCNSSCSIPAVQPSCSIAALPS